MLHKTIESVLERGEKIDSLVAKSEYAQPLRIVVPVALTLM